MSCVLVVTENRHLGYWDPLVSLLLNGLGLNVPEAMCAVRFLDAQASNPILQQLVCRLYPKTLGSGTYTLASSLSPPPSIGFATSVKSPFSSVSSPSYPPPKDKQIRKTSTGQQQDRSNKKHQKNHHKLAHKRATTIYAEEKVKSNGKSAEVVCTEVNNIFVVKLSARW